LGIAKRTSPISERSQSLLTERKYRVIEFTSVEFESQAAIATYTPPGLTDQNPMPDQIPLSTAAPVDRRAYFHSFHRKCSFPQQILSFTPLVPLWNARSIQLNGRVIFQMERVDEAPLRVSETGLTKSSGN
jgi:hypothetical protein